MGDNISNLSVKELNELELRLQRGINCIRLQKVGGNFKLFCLSVFMIIKQIIFNYSTNFVSPFVNYVFFNKQNKMFLQETQALQQRVRYLLKTDIFISSINYVNISFSINIIIINGIGSYY